MCKNNLHHLVSYVLILLPSLSVVFLFLFSMFISHIARYAPSQQRENNSKIQAETDAAYYSHITLQRKDNGFFRQLTQTLLIITTN